MTKDRGKGERTSRAIEMAMRQKVKHTREA